MLAGFALGLVLAAVAEPRRLANQLFGLTDGFLGPLFFVWVGASLSLRGLLAHPEFILLGVALGVGAILAHLAMRIFRQPAPLAAMAASQFGVPISAATIGQQTHILSSGKSALTAPRRPDHDRRPRDRCSDRGRTQVDSATPDDEPAKPKHPGAAAA